MSEAGELVVVPNRPGALVRFEPRSREADELDALIDELFGPVDDERAGVFDIVLLVGGAGLVGWSVWGGAPAFVLVIGLIALGLGVILPSRMAWRAVRSRRVERRRQAVLARGVPLRLGHPAVDRLVGRYDDLVGLAATSSDYGDAALRLAHVALAETATLLQGASPNSPQEDDYVGRRADAVDRLVAALRAQAATSPESRASLVEARRDIDELSGPDAVQQIDGLIAEVRADHGG